MFEVVWILGVCLLVVGLADTKARPMTLLLWLALIQTTLATLTLDSIDHQVMIRPVIDIVICRLAMLVSGRGDIRFRIVLTYIGMMVVHGIYWIAWFSGVDLWYMYPHVINVLWLMQTAVVAGPKGGEIIGRASAFVGAWVSSWRAMALGRFLGACNRPTRQEGL